MRAPAEVEEMLLLRHCGKGCQIAGGCGGSRVVDEQEFAEGSRRTTKGCSEGKSSLERDWGKDRGGLSTFEQTTPWDFFGS